MLEKIRSWEKKTQKLNKGKELKVGDRVSTLLSCQGCSDWVVMKIWPGVSIEDHGSVELKEFGGTIEEHFVHFGWQKILRIID